MLVDQYGNVIITNDGVTILENMEVNHPAARMIVNLARSQKDQVGDGTTTTTILASALVSEGANQIFRGVPASKIIEGIKGGMDEALKALKGKARPIKSPSDLILKHIALVAGRGNDDIATLVVDAALEIGAVKLFEDGFKLSECVTAIEGASNRVLLGIIVDKEPVNEEMPRELSNAKVLIIDDALEPEELDDDALRTEAGFKKYEQLVEEYRQSINLIKEIGVTLVLVDRGITDYAEEILTEAGVIICHRVASRELRRTAEYVGARPIKRNGLKRSREFVESCTGYADNVYVDEKLQHLRVEGGHGKPAATIMVGASTSEVVGERERIAQDAASAVQAAILEGYVPGGGASEIAVMREVASAKMAVKGMASYGWDCVIEALKKPFSLIVANAGFNPLEKVEDVIAAQSTHFKDSFAMDSDSGDIVDMEALGVVDPLSVKVHALKAASEVSQAILRIDTLVRKRDDGPGADRQGLPERY